ncbi:serine O-acetyltransferase [Phycisphaerales bacterium]|nr:serine O-acetyltransferase [Phycisphaerales bacterium]
MVATSPAAGPWRAWLWSVLGTRLYRLTFHNWYGVRRAILRLFGASVHRTARLRGSARIWAPWNLEIGEESAVGDGAMLVAHAPIRIGKFCTISQYAHVCSGGHEAGDTRFGLVAEPIVIGDDSWIAADAYVGPGVRVGEGAIVAARANAYRDVPEWTIVAGEGERVSARPMVG